jgi:uncharacterized repeat protein (TIGR01451 family)
MKFYNPTHFVGIASALRNRAKLPPLLKLLLRSSANSRVRLLPLPLVVFFASCSFTLPSYGAATPPIVSVPSPLLPTRTLVNPSFEDPAGSGYVTYEGYIPGQTTYNGTPVMQGWYSTHPASGGFTHRMEIWAQGFNGVPSDDGNQHIELNAEAQSAVYQDICILAGEKPVWSAAHGGRSSNTPGVADVAEVFISDPNAWTGVTFSGTKLYSAYIATSANGAVRQFRAPTGGYIGSNNQRTVTTSTSTYAGWGRYSDQWAGTSTGGKYRFAFQSISSAQGSVTYGNFLDNIKLGLSPTIEFADNTTTVNKTTQREDDGLYYITLRVNGEMKSAGSVEIGLGGTSTISSSDYTVVSATSNGKGGTSTATATKLPNGNISVTIPAKTYNINEPVDYITIGLDFKDTIGEPTETAIFNLQNPSGGGSSGVLPLILGNSACNPKISQTLTVTDGANTTASNVLLVKRITKVNGFSINDGKDLGVFVDDTTSTHQNDDNDPKWPDRTNYLIGAIDAGKVKPGDLVEYTIYFLNSGGRYAKSVRICARIAPNQTFQLNTYGTGKGMRLVMGSTIPTNLDLTNLDDPTTTDRGQFVSTTNALISQCNLKSVNDNGTAVLDATGSSGSPTLTSMPNATTISAPDNSYGLWRFVTKINP